MRKPEQRNSQTQAVERSWGIPAPLSSAVAKSTQQPSSEGVELGIEQREQESISQSSNQEQFFAELPFDKPGAFKSEFGFVVADGHLDLPTAGIGVHDIPGIVRTADWLSGKQIPGGLIFAACHN